jgi:hypothetical protein
LELRQTVSGLVHVEGGESSAPFHAQSIFEHLDAPNEVDFGVVKGAPFAFE